MKRKSPRWVVLSVLVGAAALAAPLAIPAGAIAVPLVSSPSAEAQADTTPDWLRPGPVTQYPGEGGTWQYGFWNAAIRSYYTVNRIHGSTVVLNRTETVRSVDTAANRKSIAEKFALNYWGNNDAYYYRAL